MEVSPPAIIIIQDEETFKDKAYDDARPEYDLKPGDKILGTLTIGYGHTDAARDDDEKIQIGDTVTEEEAKEILTKDLQQYVDIVNNRMKSFDVELTQAQFDGLVFATMNRPEKMSGGALWRAIGSGNEDKIREEWTKTISQSVKDFPGLEGRKEEELAAFTEGGQEDIIAREQRLFEEAASPGISTARNRLRDEVTAGTGGLFTTPGGQQAISGFEAEVSADKAGRNLQAIDRAEVRRKLLEGEELSTLNSLVAFQNQPLAAANLALSTAGQAAPGNRDSAALLAQNEAANREATSNFLSMIVGGFLGTSAGGSIGAGFGANTGFGSQAALNTLGNPNQFAGLLPYGSSTPAFSTRTPAYNTLYGNQLFANQ